MRKSVTLEPGLVAFPKQRPVDLAKLRQALDREEWSQQAPKLKSPIWRDLTWGLESSTQGMPVPTEAMEDSSSPSCSQLVKSVVALHNARVIDDVDFKAPDRSHFRNLRLGRVSYVACSRLAKLHHAAWVECPCRIIFVGSKSEHTAFFLVTANRRYLLRRKGAPPYNDIELAKLENQQITCDGLLADKLLLAENIQIVDES